MRAALAERSERERGCTGRILAGLRPSPDGHVSKAIRFKELRHGELVTHGYLA